MSRPRSRGFTAVKDQSGVPKGRRRYRFDTLIMGIRYREQVVCPPSVVETMYKIWLNAILSPVREDVRLNELVSEFLTWYGMAHPGDHINVVTRQLSAFQSFFENGRVSINTIRRRDVEKFLAGLLGKIAPATANRYQSTISMFFTWLIRNEYYNGHNPASGLKVDENNTREINLEPDQVREILSSAQKIGYHCYTVVSLALLTGMRRSEILGLQWEQIRGREIELSSRETKSGKARTVVLPEILTKYLDSVRSTGRVFEDYPAHALRRDWERIRSSLTFSIPYSKLKFHDLRHAFAGLCRRSKIKIDDISAQVGHSSILITESRYAQKGGYGLAGQIDRITKLLELSTL